MNRFAGKVLETTKRHPFLVGGFVFTLVPWVIVYTVLINIKYIRPAPNGTDDHRGEFLLFAVIVALILAGILSTVAAVNLVIQKDKSFYAKLIALIIVVNFSFYVIGMIW